MSSDTTADQTPRQAPPGRDQLPPALSSMWRLCKLGYTHEPRLVVLVVILTCCRLCRTHCSLWLALMAEALPAANSVLLFATLAAMAASAT